MRDCETSFGLSELLVERPSPDAARTHSGQVLEGYPANVHKIIHVSRDKCASDAPFSFYACAAGKKPCADWPLVNRHLIQRKPQDNEISCETPAPS